VPEYIRTLDSTDLEDAIDTIKKGFEIFLNIINFVEIGLVVLKSFRAYRRAERSQ
jgi:hypothetical protein